MALVKKVGSNWFSLRSNSIENNMTLRQFKERIIVYNDTE